MSTNNRMPYDEDATRSVTSRDHLHKGAMEDGQPITTSNAPGLDEDGLPNDETGIAAYALGARVDGSQG